MSDLSMGKIIQGKNKDKIFKIKPDDTQAHTIITGQSGSGKSTLVARYIEEILMSGASSALLLDLNYEFVRFNKVNDKSFKETYKKKGVANNNLKAFKKEWKKVSKGFKLIPAEDIYINFRDLNENMAYSISIDPLNDPGAYWLIQLVGENQKFKTRITSKKDLVSLSNNINRWYEKRFNNEDKEILEEIHHIIRHVNPVELTKFANGINLLNQQSCVGFKKGSPSKININLKFIDRLIKEYRFCAIDLLNFKYTEHQLRNLIVLHTLSIIWEVVRDKFRKAKEEEKDIDYHLYIIIDEAHNIIPTEAEIKMGVYRKTADMIKTIAAEGRKFGLSLILISQRPDKINELVFSECSNFIIMKSSKPSADIISDKLNVDDINAKRIKNETVNLNTGGAFYWGKINDYELTKVEGDIRRTQK